MTFYEHFCRIKGFKVISSQRWQQKKSDAFWIRGYIFRDFTIVNLVFGRSGFNSQLLQTLRAHNFEALQPTSPKITFFETSDLYLLV